MPKIYDQMVKVFGVDDDILGRLAAWYKSQDRRGEARATYRRFKNQINGLAQVAVMCREEKKYPEAVAIYRQLVGLDEKDPTRWGDLIGTTYREAKKPDEAVAAYQELIASDPEHVSRWQWNIAITYRDFNRFKEAIGVFRQCDNFPENYKQMAWCHLRLKEYNEALVLYHQVLGGHEPSAPSAQLQIAYTYRSAGQKEKAIQSLQRVCDKFPKSGQASEAHAFLQREYKINYTKGGGTAGADN